MGPPRFASPPSQCNNLSIGPNSARSGAASVYSGNSPLYQVDYTCVNAGRTVGATKRRIRWRFGFADAKSLAEGRHGTDCRGEEHEITLTWSLTSGKQIVQADGIDVHVSCKPYETVFECGWSMRGDHVVRIKGHAKPAALLNADERQFDMWIDGRSFFDFDQIYTLGHYGRYKKCDAQHTRAREDVQEPPRPARKALTVVTKPSTTPPSESVEWPVKKNFTFNESTPRTVSTFADSSSSFDFMSQPNTPTADAGFRAAPAPTLESMPSMYEPQYGGWLPATSTNSHYQNPSSSINPEFERQHRMSQVEYQVQEAYKQATLVVENQNAAAPRAAGADRREIPTEISAQVVEKENVEGPDKGNSEAYFEGDEFYTTPMLEHPDAASVVAPSPVDPMDELVHKLCNLNDITSAPEQEAKLTLNPLKKKEQDEKKKKITKSSPTAPTTTTWYGPQPTLSELKAVQVPKAVSEREVMRASIVQQTGTTGQMVIYGQPGAQNPHEAPPLEKRPQGFGIGAYTNPGYGAHTAAVPPQQYANYSY